MRVCGIVWLGDRKLRKGLAFCRCSDCELAPPRLSERGGTSVRGVAGPLRQSRVVSRSSRSRSRSRGRSRPRSRPGPTPGSGEGRQRLPEAREERARHLARDASGDGPAPSAAAAPRLHRPPVHHAGARSLLAGAPATPFRRAAPHWPASSGGPAPRARARAVWSAEQSRRRGASSG